MKKAFVITLALLSLGLGALALVYPQAAWAFLLLGPLLALAIYDLVQKKHTILRNYPVIGHLRYMMEDARHHIRQYLIQGDKEGDPFTRPQRAVVYQRAKDVSDVQAFGTLLDPYAPGYEWFEHSINALQPNHDHPRVSVGSKQCSQPYAASILNVSAMSFGSLSSHAILALNAGARAGGFAHDTGEGGLSRYHLEPGGDIIWEIGTGYFGCRREDGGFDEDRFRDKAQLPAVRMVEIKLSQGAKPGGGGILPAAKVTADIAAARGVPVGQTVESPPRHATFDSPVGLLEFVARLRELCGGKPVGFKLCIGRPAEFMAIVKAMRDTGIVPDFITIDGSEGGTGAAPVELTNHMGKPLSEGLMFAHNVLVGASLRGSIRLIACGKIITGFDIAARLAIGADLCGSARGMMFALGCIQARRCQTNTCPSGVATQDPWRRSGLVVSEKSVRVANFHRNTLYNLSKVMGSCGLTDTAMLTADRLMRRISNGDAKSYAQLFDWLEPGALLTGGAPLMYADYWASADAATF